MPSSFLIPQFSYSFSSTAITEEEMLQCLPPEPATFSSSAAVHRTSQSQSPMQDPATASSMDVSPSPGSSSTTINLHRVYTSVLRTHSYKEMLSITRSMDRDLTADADSDPDDGTHLQRMLTQVLRPDPQRVHHALHRSKSTSNTLATLISSYFRFSEETTGLALTLRRSIAKARRLYGPLHTLLNDLPIDSLTHSHCDLVFQEFVKFDRQLNPFPRPDSQTFDGIRDLFCDLKRQLERRLRKSSSRIRLVRYAAAEPDAAICCGGAVCTAYIPPKFARRELAYAAQLRVASRNTYVLKTDLDTLDSLVGRLHNAVEDDKRFIRLGLNLGNDKHTVQEVLKQLGKNHQNLVHYLVLLEEKICTCFITVNHSRSQLLQEILLHQPTSESSDS